MAEIPKNSTPNMGSSFKTFLKDVWSFFYDLLDLKEGMDRKGTIQNIKNNKRMRGANAWLLMCSIMIASVGLDLDSPAVIIGAMLISPLMSPILGVGLGVGINDKETLYISLQHFGIAIGIALFTSTFYFFFTPFGDATPQILKRTEPNTLDALVALFGGIAGIISGSRIDKSSAIPGVAIATALMPPLCVTGFGIATGNFTIILNSFYLFFLNATLVAFATFLIVRFLRFPMKQYETEKEKRNMHLLIYTISLLIIIPSIFILNQVWKEFKLKQNIENFIVDYSKEEMRNIDSWEIIERDSFNILGIKVYGTEDEHFNKQTMQQALNNYGIKNTRVELIYTSEVDWDNLKKLESKIDGFEHMAEDLKLVSQKKSEQALLIEQLQSQLDSIQSDTLAFSSICSELKAAFPAIDQVAFAEAKESNFRSVNDLPILLLRWQAKTPLSTIRQEEPRVQNFIRIRANLDTLKIVRY